MAPPFKETGIVAIPLLSAFAKNTLDEEWM
jgi:hypothetical protein